MKKSTRFFLMGAAILSLLGAVFLIVGTIFGGFSQGMKLLSNGECSWSFFSPDWSDWNDDYHFNYTFSDEFNTIGSFSSIPGNYEEQEIADVTEISKIAIQVGGGTMSLKESDDNTFRISAQHNNRYEYAIVDNTLYVKGKNAKNIHTGNEVILYVPKNAAITTTEVQIGGGILEADSISANDVVIGIGAGEANIDDISADSMEMEIGAGDMNVENGAVGTVTMECAMGNIDFEGSISGDSTIECSMGNISLDIDGDEEDFNYEVDCAAGDVSIGDMEASGFVGERSIDNQADKKMQIECAMGSIDVNF